MPTIERVSFRLSGVSHEDFITAIDAVNRWLDARAGFLRRELAESGDGTWLDVITWESADAARAAARAMQEKLDDFPAMRRIDPASIAMRHATIKLGA